MRFRILLLSLLPLSSFGFEINTHQAITSCALSNKCLNGLEQQGAENLNYFALTMQLNGVNYSEQIFENYTLRQTYFEYVIESKGLGGAEEGKKGKLLGFEGGKTYLKNAADKEGDFIYVKDKDNNDTTTIANLLPYSKNSYISLIEAGSILEDAVYPLHDNDGDGRFNNHFYSAQFSVAARTPYVRDNSNPIERTFIQVENLLRESDRALLSDDYQDAYGRRTDNISWALDSTVSLKASGLLPDPTEITYRRNDYNLPKAI